MSAHYNRSERSHGLFREGFFLIILTTLMLSGKVNGQKILTLKECYESAMSSNALSGEKSAYSEISRLKDKNISSGRLPTLDFNGSLIYNSSVMDLSSALGSLPVPGIADAINPLPHEQYKMTLDINQTLYDGGMIKGARILEKTELRVNEKQTEADIYKIRTQINTTFFSLLLTDRQKELLQSYLELINKRILSMQSALENGVMLKSDIDILTSEKIRTEQQLTENDIRKASLLKILSALTGREIDASVELALPVNAEIENDELSRPELQLFDLKNEQLTAGVALIESRRMPKAFAFATLGYGNPPGSNFFKDEFAPYYILGAGLKWNIFDWNKAKNEKQVISIQKNIVESRKQDFSETISRQLESKKAEIASLRSMTESDSQLIALRKRITLTSESQYLNGTITATEYLNILNAERQALINSEIHKINLVLAGVEYLNISGQEIE